VGEIYSYKVEVGGSNPPTPTIRKNMNIRYFTEKLSWEQLYQIFDDFEQLEKDSVIGDCFLRKTTEEIQLAINQGQQDGNIIMWMNMVVNDCYRIVAEKAMESGFYHNNGKSFYWVKRKKK
jgi:phosphoribulokinase